MVSLCATMITGCSSKNESAESATDVYKRQGSYCGGKEDAVCAACLRRSCLLYTSQVFGVGCKIFTIAGPVILYGIFTSWLLGFIYYLLQWTGVIS